jgi:hypothetical protein
MEFGIDFAKTGRMCCLVAFVTGNVFEVKFWFEL